MALKMVYLAPYPLAAAAALALAGLWQVAVRASGAAAVGVWLRERAGGLVAWVLVLLLGGAVARPLVAAGRPTPVVSEPLYLAGQWARAHVQRACVDYLVADGDTGYWLHLAVLGNPRAGARMEQADAFDPHEAIVRWVTPGGLPFAIADLRILPRDVLASVDVLARFGPAIVVKRRGATSCSAGQQGQGSSGPSGFAQQGDTSAGGAGRGRPARPAGPPAVTGAFRAEDGWGCPATGPALRHAIVRSSARDQKPAIWCGK